MVDLIKYYTYYSSGNRYLILYPKKTWFMIIFGHFGQIKRFKWGTNTCRQQNSRRKWYVSAFNKNQVNCSEPYGTLPYKTKQYHFTMPPAHPAGVVVSFQKTFHRTRPRCRLNDDKRLQIAFQVGTTFENIDFAAAFQRFVCVRFNWLIRAFYCSTL